VSSPKTKHLEQWVSGEEVQNSTPGSEISIEADNGEIRELGKVGGDGEARQL